MRNSVFRKRCFVFIWWDIAIEATATYVNNFDFRLVKRDPENC
jgi:hypothetical protein